MTDFDPVSNTTGKFTQTDFSGGMNLFGELSALGPTEYGLAFNVRNRTKALKPVKNYILDDEAPSGKKQGIYGFDDYILIFVAGFAYYRRRNTTGWTQVRDFLMSATADRIFVQAVPASTLNLTRALISNTAVNGTALNPGINLTATVISTTLSGLVCQDGITQPFIILFDGSCRPLQTYAQWSLALDKREYVPIGKQMALIDGILLLMSADGKQLYRSVSGRPIDFVVNIDASGDKGGDATTVAYSVDYNPATILKELNTGQILIGTSLQSHIIEFNYNSLVFGEPTFNAASGLDAGIVNQFCYVDVLGDSAFIDFNGLRSFNAVEQEKNEGRNSVFSANIDVLLANISQTDINSAAIEFDNFALFGVLSKYGYVIAVYDMKLSKWVCVDNLVGSSIKQFAVVSEFDALRLFAITGDDNVIELYSDDAPTYAQASVQTPEFTSGDAAILTRLQKVRTVHNHDAVNDRVIVKPFVDSVGCDTQSHPLTTDATGIPYSVTYPVNFGISTGTSPILFDYTTDSKTGWRISAFIKWSSAARLVQLQVETVADTSNVSMNQQTKTPL